MSSDAAPLGFDRLFVRPVQVGRMWLPPPGLLVLASIGAIFLLVVAVYRWPFPQDELSYYIGARRLIDGLAVPVPVGQLRAALQ